MNAMGFLIQDCGFTPYWILVLCLNYQKSNYEVNESNVMSLAATEWKLLVIKKSKMAVAAMLDF